MLPQKKASFWKKPPPKNTRKSALLGLGGLSIGAAILAGLAKRRPK